jgi:protein TonB
LEECLQKNIFITASLFKNKFIPLHPFKIINQKTKIVMELKKSDKANLDRKRGLFIEIGLLVALGFALLAFEWRVAPKEEGGQTVKIEEEVMEESVPVTRETTPPPPPPEPPKVTDMLEVVTDDIVVNNDININFEADQTTEITPIVFEETVVEEEEEEVMFAIVEDKPLFNGKDAETAFHEWVYSKTVYPPVAQENGISGRVFVEFSISKTGEVVDVKIMRGVDPLLDKEALRVISMSPKWTPGMQRGKPVKVKYTFPFMFRLNN